MNLEYRLQEVGNNSHVFSKNKYVITEDSNQSYETRISIGVKTSQKRRHLCTEINCENRVNIV